MRSFDRSDQKYQNSRATLSLSGVRFKQAVVHLFTMSKDPAKTHPVGWRVAKLALCVATYWIGIRRCLTRKWWSQTGSNRRHPACKAGALPAELWPHQGCRQSQELVGPGRLELPTSRLSGVRSNHLSYGPCWHTPEDPSARSGERTLTHEYVACEERETKAASVPQ